ncbi:NAD(P)H-dependent oxidoreductase [Paenibacillus sp. NEAU-GSW1]|uniref:NAD(P)H-dependent oxidoreductase n=1 Tax=Paenibacillus sp. NEAU-GSW1 TaxID=2682486 RepID=UPI0012E2FE92|nr:NAD(P)H-dependent oxidoreductase [Paenibacillus sp. NEAU-GSW1]MUT64666.1 NAD(P)H-dependent oxidoreductase [Paenibacillus sp. NEAU-GSW1]
MNKSEILEAYSFRHACKRFDPAKEVSREDIEFILETGRLSPSSFGLEPWKFVVLQNKEIREKLLPVSWGAQGQLPTASYFVIALARKPAEMTANSDYIQSLWKDTRKLPPEVLEKLTANYHRFLESDFELLGNERAMFEWASRQVYIALGNMMTSAALIGIDSCPIEGFDKNKAEAILREEGVLKGDSFGIACMVAFGYRESEPRAKTRRAADDVIEWVH